MKLFSFELAWARVAFETIFPGSPARGLVSVGGMNIEAFVSETCAHFTPRAAVGLRAAIWLTALAPLFLLGRAATLGALGRADREAVLERLITSDIYGVRSLALLLKTVGALLYAGAAPVRARMNAHAPAEGGALITLGTKRPLRPRAA